MLKQSRVPANSDFVSPPNPYTLFSLDASTTLILGKQKLEVGIGIHNLFNISYRDYLSRLRYYTDDLGRNISLRLRIPFTIH